jgi:hypothetical protein
MMGFCRPTHGLTVALSDVFELNAEERTAWKRLDHAACLASNVRVRDGAEAQSALVSPFVKRADKACQAIQGHLANLAFTLEALEKAKDPPAETLRFARLTVAECEQDAVALRKALTRLHRPVSV